MQRHCICGNRNFKFSRVKLMRKSLSVFSELFVRLIQSNRSVIAFGTRFVNYLQNHFGFFNLATTIFKRGWNPVSIQVKRTVIVRIRPFKKVSVKRSIMLRPHHTDLTVIPATKTGVRRKHPFGEFCSFIVFTGIQGFRFIYCINKFIRQEYILAVRIHIEIDCIRDHLQVRHNTNEHRSFRGICRNSNSHGLNHRIQAQRIVGINNRWPHRQPRLILD